MEVGGHLYVAIQPAGAPPALALDRVLAGLQRVNLDDGHASHSSENGRIIIGSSFLVRLFCLAVVIPGERIPRQRKNFRSLCSSSYISNPCKAIIIPSGVIRKFLYTNDHFWRLREGQTIGIVPSVRPRTHIAPQNNPRPRVLVHVLLVGGVVWTSRQ